MDTPRPTLAAYLAASLAHARIMERRAARLARAPLTPAWEPGALDRLAADLGIAPRR